MASKIRIPNNWRPRAYQMNVWRYLERGGKRAICIWHRRAGKDDVCLHWAASSMIDKPATYWHMLPAYSQGRKAIWTAVNPHTGKRRIDEAFPHELWDVAAGAETARLDGHSGWVRALCLLPDGRLASGSRDNTIRLWDMAAGAETARLDLDASAIVIAAPRPNLIVAGDRIGRMHWLEIED